MQITFLGASETVTGSKFLVRTRHAQILVDCGLFQGLKLLRRRNWQPLPVAPSQVDAVVLTHAHIDHSGYLPVLARDGFRGPIYCTLPTQALCNILLPDSGHLQEEEAAFANRHGYSKHKPALPLYTEQDAHRVADRFESRGFDTPLKIADLEVRFRSAGHILGASTVELFDGHTRVLFSGDLGRHDDLLMRPPDPPGKPDVLVMETTYGDRLHDPTDPMQTLETIAKRTFDRGGVLLVPSFAVGRAQALLWCFHQLIEQHRLPDVPVYLNSPMATDVTELYQQYASYHRLTQSQCAAMCQTATLVQSIEESRKLNELRGPAVVISASGMVTGGRILHHIKAMGPDPRNTILLPGFQAPGTRGDALAGGAEHVKIHGEYVPIKAEVDQLHVLSAHADQNDLIRWASSCEARPDEILLVHGEPTASDALRLRLQEQIGWESRAVEYRETMEL